MIDITALLLTAIICSLVNIGLANISSAHKTRLRYFITGYFFCLLMIYIEHFLEYSGYSESIPHSIFASSSFHFMLAPMLNLVIKSFFAEEIDWKKFGLELIPAIAVTVYMIGFYLLPGDDKFSYLVNYRSARFIAPRHMILICILLVQTLIYSLVWYNRIKNYALSIKNRSSSSDIEFIPWMSALIGLITIFTFSIVFAGLVRVSAPDQFSVADQAQNAVLSFIPVVFIFLMFFLPERPFPQVATPTIDKPRPKTIRQADIVQLQMLMVEEKLYLKPELSLIDVAERIELSRHELSNLLSSGLQKNFYDFINEYRIDYAKQLMNSDMVKTFSLAGIARESGFNNYVSFYRVFKRFTKVSPSKYLESRSQED